jgi:L-ascorbate metabolism protein UlaG (beta-lactamase superfamily)
MRRRTLLKLAALPVVGAAFGGIASMARASANPYYSGPPSDHFDGERFFNPDGSSDKSPGDLLRWRFTGTKEAWPDTWFSPFRDRPPARVEGRELRVAFAGHASFLYQTAGLNILVDPVWSDRVSPVTFAGPRRVNPPGIAFEDLPKIDVVLLTHNHYDHLDAQTLRRLAEAHAPRVVTPLGNDAVIRQEVGRMDVTTGDWGDVVELSPDLRVHLEPVKHWSARGLLDRRRALWSAFLIETPGGSVYHIGDTGYGDGRHFEAVGRKHKTIRLATLPIGAYEPRWFMRDHHIDPDEAVRIFETVGARQALGHHWGTFRLTDEGVTRPAEALSSVLAARRIPLETFRALRPGEAVTLPPLGES